MKRIWIVVADAGRALILSKIEGINGLRVVRRLENPLGRARNTDILSDAPGRVEKHGSGMRSAMSPATDAHEQKARDFAHQLNEVIHAAASRNEFESLAFVAPAHFLGLLRGGIKSAPHHRLVWGQAKDLMRLSISELENRLGDLLAEVLLGTEAVSIG